MPTREQITMSNLISPRRVTRQCSRRLIPDARGATVVEFAIIVVPFFAIVFAILTTSLTFFAQQGLETVAANLGRSLLTGQIRAGNMTKAQFKALACTKLPAYLRCPNLIVSIDKSIDFASINYDKPVVSYANDGSAKDSSPYNLGSSGDIVTLRLMYVWPLPSVGLGLDLGTLPGGKRLLIATSVAKTEYYS